MLFPCLRTPFLFLHPANSDSTSGSKYNFLRETFPKPGDGASSPCDVVWRNPSFPGGLHHDCDDCNYTFVYVIICYRPVSPTVWQFWTSEISKAWAMLGSELGTSRHPFMSDEWIDIWDKIHITWVLLGLHYPVHMQAPQASFVRSTGKGFNPPNFQCHFSGPKGHWLGKEGHRQMWDRAWPGSGLPALQPPQLSGQSSLQKGKGWVEGLGKGQWKAGKAILTEKIYSGPSLLSSCIKDKCCLNT